MIAMVLHAMNCGAQRGLGSVAFFHLEIGSWW